MMKSLKASILGGILLLLMPFLSVYASSTTVNTESEFKSALADQSITDIIIGKDIDTTEKINITRPVTIEGNNHTLKYVGTFGSDKSPSNKVWGGIYILQVYKTMATIRNIKLTGGNAALLVNGGQVKLEGTIDVSGNGFGGIELGQGAGVESVARLDMDKDTNIVNTTESSDTPTLWVPTDSDSAIISKDGKEQTIAPGEEIRNEVLNAIFEEQVNPKTNDESMESIILTSCLGIFGLETFGYSFKKYFN